MPDLITDCRYLDEARSVVLCKIDGKDSSVPVNPENRHWREILDQHLEIADPE